MFKQKCIDYTEKWPLVIVIFLYDLYIFITKSKKIINTDLPYVFRQTDLS